MIQIAGMIQKAKAEGYNETNAEAKVCQDIDLDFIRYPLQDEAILAFVNKLNSVGLVSIQMTGVIEELNQQDYHGRRIHIAIQDAEGTLLSSKIDLGVHKHFDIEQEDFCFDVGIDDIGASLLINSKEQMLTAASICL